MRSCDLCGKEITALTGSVQLRTDQWNTNPRPYVIVEFCSWKHCIQWIEKNKDEILAARALLTTLPRQRPEEAA